MTLIIAGMWRWAGRGREYRWWEARGSVAQLRWGPGAKPTDCHETNLKCFINKGHEMRHDL